MFADEIEAEFEVVKAKGERCLVTVQKKGGQGGKGRGSGRSVKKSETVRVEDKGKPEGVRRRALPPWKTGN
jgi:hypothetical protein